MHRGTSLMRKRQPPKEEHRALGVGWMYGPRKWCFPMSEVPLHATEGWLEIKDRLRPKSLRKFYA